jgi:hypothetical protein
LKCLTPGANSASDGVGVWHFITSGLSDFIRRGGARISQAVARVFCVPPEYTRQPGRRVNLPREAVALLAREMTGESLESLRCALGVGGSGVSEIARRSRERLQRDSRFRELVERARRELQR